MKKLLKALAIPILGLTDLMIVCGSFAGHLISHILSWIVGFAMICAIWAWLIGDEMAPLFLGVGTGFFLLMAAGAKLFDESTVLASKLKKFIKSC